MTIGQELERSVNGSTVTKQNKTKKKEEINKRKALMEGNTSVWQCRYIPIDAYNNKTSINDSFLIRSESIVW